MSQLSALGNPAATNAQTPGYQLGGQLNFGKVPGLTDYQGAYQNALALNQSNYANILGGYQTIMGNQQRAQQGIQAGYGQLYGDVMNTIQGIGASQGQAIKDVYAQQSGATAQSMINRGLGNTTVQDSMQRGNLYDEQKAQIALANQMAQLQAGYQSNLGMAGLNYANQANMQNTGLGSQQLGFMNSVNSPYPNPQAYANIAQMQGYAQAAKNLAGRVGGGGGGGGGMGGPGPLNFGKMDTGQFLPNAPSVYGQMGAGYVPTPIASSGIRSGGPPIDTQGNPIQPNAANYGPTYEELGLNQYGQAPAGSFGPTKAELGQKPYSLADWYWDNLGIDINADTGVDTDGE